MLLKVSNIPDLLDKKIRRVYIKNKDTKFMPSVSQVQQTAFAMALAARKGKIPVSQLKGSALSIYKSKMSNKQLEDFAETKRKGLPLRKNKKKRWVQSDTGKVKI